MRRLVASVSFIAFALFVVSCGDGSGSPLTVPQASQSVAPQIGANGPVPGTCATPSQLTAEVNAVEPPGTARGSVQGDIGKMVAAVNKGDFAGAKTLAFGINISLIQQFRAHALVGTTAQVTKLINDVFCYAGLAITITDPGSIDVVLPTDGPRILISGDGNSGVSFPGGAVSEPTFIAFTPIPDTFGGTGAGPLHTKLDQYASFVDISSFSATGAPLVKPAIVAVCPPPGMDPIVRARLRVGHDAHAGFEITPPANGGFLACTGSVGAAPGRISRWLNALASVFTPRAAYARMTMFAAGGVGGTAGEFSPFDAIDPQVSFSGGVGGTAGEFQVIPRNPAGLDSADPRKAAASSPSAQLSPGSPSLTVVAGVCTDTATFTGGVLEQQCSPAIALTTNRGTKLTKVPVAWSISTGGGTVAAAVASPWSCGTFGSTAATLTDANGQAQVCWTMGPTAGRHNNTVIATPSAGGDAPPGVSFAPTVGSFTASALNHVAVATATGTTVVFDNLPHGGTAACSDGLVPVLSYTSGNTTLAGPPVDAGSYTLTVTCGDGGVKFVTGTNTAPIVITPAPTSTTVSCPASVPFNGSPLTPCTVAVTGPALSLHPTPDYSSNTLPGTATASYTYPAGGNWLGSTGTATFLITTGTPAAGAVGVTVVFDNAPHAGSGTCSDGLVPVLSYKVGTTPLSGAPIDAGSYTLTVTCGDGGVKFTTVTNTAPIVITPAPTTTAVSCPASVAFTGSPLTPCTASVTGPALSLHPTPTYSANTAPGTATASYTYAGGGNWLGSTGSATFLITTGTPVAAATGATVVFDNAPHAGSGTCSDGLVPVLSYKAGNTALPGAPVDAGSYTLTVTCGDGVNYAMVTNTAPIVITPAPTTTAVSCPVSAAFTGSPLTPCSATVSGPALSLHPTPSYSANTAPGTATASYTYAGGGNWLGSTGSATFLITTGTPVATATGTTVVFDNAPHAGSGTCTDGLVPVLSYKAGNTALPGAPVDAGSYTLTVTCGDGVNYAMVTNTAPIVITPAPTTTAVSCPVSAAFTGSPLTPCSATVSGPALSLHPTPSYSANTAPGTATASYTYAGGGNWLGSTGSATFLITTGTPVATATGTTVVFDNAPHAGSGTCSDGLVPVLSYKAGNTALPGAPVDAGSYTLTVTCGDGVNYAMVTNSAPIVITPAPTTTAVSCPVSAAFTGSPLTPCSATVSGPALSLHPTPSYSANTAPGTATASYTYAGGGNWLGSTGSATFLITTGTPVATATGTTVVFDNAPHAGSGTCSDGLVPVLSYKAGNTALPGAPVDAGSYTLTVTCGDGVNYAMVTNTAPIVITPAPTTTAVSCPVSAAFTGSPLTPCSATVSGPALSLHPTPSYSANTAPGTATASYTYAGGGNWLGSTGSATFLITTGTPVATATGATVAFDNAPHAGSGSCTDGLVPVLSYKAGNTALPGAPVDAGSYTLTVTCGDGVNYAMVTNTAPIVITPAPTTTAVSCPVSAAFTGSPLTPCSATVSGPALSLHPTPSYSANTAPGTATASYTYAGGGNWLGSTGSATFLITTGTPVATATGATVVFDNAPHAGSGSCTDGLVPVLSYKAGNTALPGAPVDAGSYTLTVTCGDGVNYAMVTNTAPIVITPAPTTTAVSCPVSAAFTGSPLTPCSATVSGPALSLHPTPSYSANTAPGTATASYTYAGGGNWLGSTGSATFLISFGFSDGFETASGWTTSGFWHRSTLTTNGVPIVNALFPTSVGAAANDVSNGALPSPFAGSWAFWYGNESAGNYLGTQATGDPNSGDTSTQPNSGTLTSPAIALPATGGGSLMLRFNTWWEIESVFPSTRDVMRISVYDVVAGTTTPLATLNPAADLGFPHPASVPFTSLGYNLAPGWVEFAHNLNAFAGRTIKLIYTFDTVDTASNGFRGWLLDNVRVAVEP